MLMDKDNRNMEHKPEQDPKAAPPRSPAPKHAAPPQAGPKPSQSAAQKPSPQPAASQTDAPKNTAQKAVAPQAAAQQNAAPQNMAPQPAAPYEAAHMAPKSTNLPMRRAQGHRLDGKAKGLIAAGIIVLVILVGLCVWFFGLRGYFAAQNASPVYVTPVSSITGVMSDLDPRYSGLVEPQKITKVNKDDTRTVSEVLVHEGDMVTAGQALFSYDTGEMDLSIRQAELELEGIANELTVLNDNKTQLEKEQKEASKDDQFKYTVEIQSVELQIKSREYDRSVKQSELDKLRDSLENNQVFSEVDGTVQEIHTTPATDSQGNPLPFMSILSSGEFRIKGTVTEMNLNSLSEGQTVTVRSRVDPDSRWTGMIESIEHEPVQDNNNMYDYGGGGEKASKYNFFVTLDAPEGLILGQHVYIEPDTGASVSRTGMWLPEMYLVVEEDGSGYVWARGEDERLEKRPVMLGQYDAGEGLYEIISGLAASDYITIPAEDLIEGGPTTTDASAMTIPGGDEPAVDPGLDPGVDPGVDPGMDPGVDPGVDSGVDPGLGYDEGAVPVIPEGGEDETDPLPDDDNAIMPRGGDDVGGEPVQ